jgi:sugar-specific transcriptional regulator TrmB
LESKSLAEQTEKQNWFNLLPIMSKEQIDKLYDILTREKQKLQEINDKYAKKQEEINKKYQQSYNPETYYQNQAKIKEEESKTRDQELVEADNLLTQI